MFPRVPYITIPFPRLNRAVLRPLPSKIRDVNFTAIGAPPNEVIE